MTVSCYLLHFLNEDSLGIVFFLLPQEKNRSQKLSVPVAMHLKTHLPLFVNEVAKGVFEVSTQPSEGGSAFRKLFSACWHSHHDVKPHPSSNRKGSNITLLFI